MFQGSTLAASELGQHETDRRQAAEDRYVQNNDIGSKNKALAKVSILHLGCQWQMVLVG